MGIILTDTSNNSQYKLKHTDGSSDTIDEFPPIFDYKIIIED